MANPSSNNLNPHIGVGLRSQHFPDILAKKPSLRCYEVLADNFLSAGGMHLKKLETIRADHELVFHSVGMNIGSLDPLNKLYFKHILDLVKRFEPATISDHLCWIGFNSHFHHDLLPLPYNEEALAHVASRVGEIQDLTGRTLLLENVSSYIRYQDSEMPEWEFLAALTQRTGCKLLLDVNNLYVNSTNHGFNAEDYLKGLPLGVVSQIHLAGYFDRGDCLIDTHGSQVSQPVWQLYRQAVARFGPQLTIVEWDNNIPPYASLLAEAQHAATIMDEAGYEA